MNPKKSLKFEERISETFIRYGRWPLFMMLGFALFLVASLYAYTNWFQVWRIKREATQYVASVTQTIDEFKAQTLMLLNDDGAGQFNRDIYPVYYALNRNYPYTNHVVILDADKHPTFTTKSMLIGADYPRLYISYILNQVSSEQSMISTLNLTSDTDMRYLIFSSTVTTDFGEQYYILLYFDTMNIQAVMNRQRSNHFVITDRFNNIVSATASDFETNANKFNPSDRSKITLQGLTYDVHVDNIYDHLLYTHVLVHKSQLHLVTLALFVAPLTTYTLLKRINKKMAKKIGKEVSESINVIVDHVKEIQAGNLHSYSTLETNDELQFLSESINDMSRDLENLIHANQRQIELRKNAEMRQLEAQFNPHFLFNTLETMRYLIVSHPERAQNMVVNMSKLLRYSISSDQKDILFEEDTQYIKMYLDIHKERLGDRLNFTIDIEPEVRSVFIPKLIIQPLVENSIKHGFKNQETLNIGVVGYSHDRFVYIHVVDDGGGMPEKLVNALNHLRGETDDADIGYGVSSVIQRINLMYGSSGSIYIDSDAMGTCITICFPNGG